MSVSRLPLSRLAKAIVLMGAAMLASTGALAHAALLGLVQNQPDLTVPSILVDYDGAGHFTAQSQDLMTYDNNNYTFSGSYSIDINFNPATPAGPPLSGTLTVLGTIPEIGANSGTLLLGNIWYFGYEDSPDPYNTQNNEFEFVFHAYAGDLASDFLTDPDGPHVGIKLHVNYSDMYDINTNPTGTQYPFTGNFNQPFTNELFYEDIQYGDAYSDNFPSVPEPSAMILLATGSFMLAWRLFWRTRRAS